MSYNEKTFTRDNLDFYLKELAKEFRKVNGKQMPAEIILIGGASILANYGFREMTTDMDAIIRASSAMKEAIYRVADKYDLSNSWLNTDFMQTDSYSPKLVEVSKHYRTFSNIVDVRTISGEYLVAMKLRSGRKYKNDLFDIVGILKEHKDVNIPITYQQIDSAVKDLYGGWHAISEDSTLFINELLKSEDKYEEYFVEKRREELEAKDILVNFEEKYPGVTKKENVNYILKTLREKRGNKMDREIKINSTYQHFKGNKYKVIAVAMHTETNEDLVIYKSIEDESKVYARPIQMFLSEVDHEKYPEVIQKYRFEEIK